MGRYFIPAVEPLMPILPQALQKTWEQQLATLFQPAQVFNDFVNKISHKPLHAFNETLDRFFYDVGSLERGEQEQLTPERTPEGAILVVGPSTATGQDRLAIYPSFAAFAHATQHHNIEVIAVAGVGSSALGAAALARNIADARNQPVLAVVSGYGMQDAMAEGLGGYFLYGSLNQLRHAVKNIDKLWNANPFYALGRTVQARALADASPDVETLFQLLQLCPHIQRLIGHSKGNLVISEALYKLQGNHPERYKALVDSNAKIITLSAKVEMPAGMEVIDVMGSMDVLGMLNSRLDIPTDIWVLGAGHHTNTVIAQFLNIKKLTTNE